MDIACKNNKMVTCSTPNSCASCGWDESTKARSLLRIRKQRASSIAVKPCPFCGSTPLTLCNEQGFSIECRNPACIRPGTDACESMDDALRKWEHRVLVR